MVRYERSGSGGQPTVDAQTGLKICDNERKEQRRACGKAHDWPTERPQHKRRTFSLRRDELLLISGTMERLSPALRGFLIREIVQQRVSNPAPEWDPILEYLLGGPSSSLPSTQPESSSSAQLTTSFASAPTGAAEKALYTGSDRSASRKRRRADLSNGELEPEDGHASSEVRVQLGQPMTKSLTLHLNPSKFVPFEHLLDALLVFPHIVCPLDRRCICRTYICHFDVFCTLYADIHGLGCSRSPSPSSISRPTCSRYASGYAEHARRA